MKQWFPAAFGGAGWGWGASWRDAGGTEPEFWRGVLPHMAEHAKLDSTGESDLLLYLVAAHGTVHGADLEH